MLFGAKLHIINSAIAVNRIGLYVYGPKADIEMLALPIYIPLSLFSAFHFALLRLSKFEPLELEVISM